VQTRIFQRLRLLVGLPKVSRAEICCVTRDREKLSHLSSPRSSDGFIYCVRSHFNPLRPGMYRFVESVTPIGHASPFTAGLVGTLLISLQILAPRRLNSLWHETMSWDSSVKKVTVTMSTTQKPVICHLT
jgi:hypothetical protein